MAKKGNNVDDAEQTYKLDKIDISIRNIIKELKALEEMQVDWQRLELMIKLSWALVEVLQEKQALTHIDLEH